MGKKYVINEKSLTSIADAIRDKTQKVEALTCDGIVSGVNEVYEAGKQAEYDVFWDNYQNNGKKMVWGSYFFAYGCWNDSNFFPKYDIKLEEGGESSVFYECGVTNIRDRIDGRGLKLILPSKNASLKMMFRFALTREVPDFDTSGVSNFVEAFQNAKNLETIPRLNVSNAKSLTSTFGGATSLKNITFEGTIPISLSFSSSPLTVESMKNIITHLKDYSGTDSEYAYTVTFLTSAFEVLETEGATAEYTDVEGNASLITWAEYIDNLKWNLVKA